MSRRLSCACLLSVSLMTALAIAPARAGHGLINSFAGIQWLPAPGVTPDSPWYAFDLAEDSAARLCVHQGSATLDLLFDQARERLAELDAMVRVRHADGAKRAVAGYAEVLSALGAALGEDDDVGRLRRVAEELLAHQYMLSTNYLDLPRDTRPLIRPMLDLAAASYRAIAARLPQQAKDALFFKEEEVRWSRDMAVAADEQGL